MGLTATRSNSYFLKTDNSGSCGRRPQQTVGGLRPHNKICGWPRGPAKYWLLAQRASKSLQASKCRRRWPDIYGPDLGQQLIHAYRDKMRAKGPQYKGSLGKPDFSLQISFGPLNVTNLDKMAQNCIWRRLSLLRRYLIEIEIFYWFH